MLNLSVKERHMQSVNINKTEEAALYFVKSS